MSGEVIATVIGNLCADPTITFTASGRAVASFTVASTPRTFDKESGKWEDAPALFLRCSLWGDPAERAVDSLGKGDRVIAQGRLKQRSYEKDGEKRTVIEMDVEEIGPSLKFASAKVTRAERNGASGGGGRKPARTAKRETVSAGNYDDDPPPF